MLREFLTVAAALAAALAVVPADAESVIGSGVYGGEAAAAPGMVTPIFAKAGSTGIEPSNSVNSFASLVGGEASSTFGTTRVARQVPWPVAGTFSRMRAYFPQALTQGSYNVTLAINGVAATSNCVIDTTNQTCPDTTMNAPTTGGGQPVAIQVIPTGTPTLQTGTVEVSFLFTSSAPNESAICAAAIGTPPNTAQNWTMFGGILGWTTTEAAQASLVAAPGTFDHLYFLGTTAVSAGSWDFNVYRNGSAGALDTGAISSGITGSDLTHSMSFAALDTMSLSATPTATPSNTVLALCGRWRPATKGQALIMSNASTIPPVTANASRFGNPAGTFGVDTTQTNPNILIPDFTTSLSISNFAVAESTAPGATATRSVDILSGPTGGAITNACGFTTTLTNSSALTVGGVAGTPAVQDNSTICSQTAGYSADTKILNGPVANAVITWLKTGAVVTVK